MVRNSQKVQDIKKEKLEKSSFETPKLNKEREWYSQSSGR